MKKLLTVILVILGISTVLSFIFASIPAFTVTGKAFLYALSNHQYEVAYDMFTDEYKSHHSMEEFTQKINQTGLNQYHSVEWMQNVSDKKGGYGLVGGIVTTTQNRKIPVQFRFTRLPSDSWFENSWGISDFRVGEAAMEGSAQ